MLSRVLTGLAGAVGTVLVMATSPVAGADEAPVLPNINVYPPISPAEFSVMDGTWYAFATPDGLTCVLDKGRNSYGCSGPIPAAPEGANLVSGVGGEEPGFANTAAPLFAVTGPVKPLPPQTRISYRNVSCAIDAGGATVCVNSATQHGFVLSPAGSFTA
ncbi:MAG TPA: hypothetical protein VF874_15200 [Mycobacterium sp.]